jgi:CDP-diacylglycerol---serine O-phosphatidyltransferase
MSFLKRNLANIFTLTNLFLGFTGIIKILSGEAITAAYLVFFAALFDLLDGFVARLMNSKSTIGKELDSLSDMVSFGVLPSMIVFSLLLKSHQEWVYLVSFLDIPVVSLLAFAIAGGAAIRLAKFNTDDRQVKNFIGLPTPAVAIFCASLPLILKNDLYLSGYQSIYLEDYILNPYILLFIVIILTWLMLSGIPIFSIKFENFKWKDNAHRYILILLFIVLFIFLYFIAIPLTILIYVLISLFLKKKILAEQHH